MKYIEVEFTLTPTPENDCPMEAATDILSALLAEVGFESFESIPTGLKAYIQQGLFDKENLEAVLNDFPLPDWHIDTQQREVEYANWNEQWEKEGFRPIVIDDRLCVHDSAHQTLPDTGAPLPSTRYELIVSPRLAFGSGTHPTTRQLLEVLLETDVNGLHVIDAGCGTGILGLLCLLRGADSVSAYDIDEWSVENARENASLNHLGLDVYLGDASVLHDVTLQHGMVDLLIANINRNILLNDMEAFVRSVKPGCGKILLSGFYEEDVPFLLDKAGTLGLHECYRKERDGWMVLMLSL